MHSCTLTPNRCVTDPYKMQPERSMMWQVIVLDVIIAQNVNLLCMSLSQLCMGHLY